MNNADMPAMAVIVEPTSGDIYRAAMNHENAHTKTFTGFTKREQACLTMGVAATGCAELDAIIEQGNRQRLAGLTMQGLLAGGYCIDDARNRLNDVPEEAINLANVLLDQLKGDV